MAPQYAAILMGISNTIGTIPGIISPAITGYLVEDKSVESWQNVFIITAFVYVIGKRRALKIYEQFVPNTYWLFWDFSKSNNSLNSTYFEFSAAMMLALLRIQNRLNLA